MCHASTLRKYVHDPSQVINFKPLCIQENLTYEEVPIEIVDRKEQQLRSKTILLVKVLWPNHGIEEASWELEQEMKNRYPYLFEDGLKKEKDDVEDVTGLMILRARVRFFHL
jgi:hypothetical protein